MNKDRSEQQQIHWGTYLRNQSILILHHQHLINPKDDNTQVAIAKRFKVTPQKVGQIIKKYYPDFLDTLLSHPERRRGCFMILVDIIIKGWKRLCSLAKIGR